MSIQPPPGIDPGVFAEIPKELQLEILSAFARANANATDPVDIGSSSNSTKKTRKLCRDDLRELTFLTYNVWFNEEAELEARMEAIVGIVRDKKPHFLALQEVTALIWNILKPKLLSLGFTDYKVQNNGTAYFVVILSRVAAASFVEHEYEFSHMARGLVYLECSIDDLFTLRVGTTHLESPVPPFRGESMNSRSRKLQLEVALKEIRADEEEYKNLVTVLMGDLNWSDKEDGPINDTCADDKWTDICTNAGYTYDAKVNGMLWGKLQGRLDRILFHPGKLVSARNETISDHVGSFNVKHESLVGNKKIDGESYKKITRNGKVINLPLFPSDHFGLLSKVSFSLTVSDEVDETSTSSRGKKKRRINDTTEVIVIE